MTRKKGTENLPGDLVPEALKKADALHVGSLLRPAGRAPPARRIATALRRITHAIDLHSRRLLARSRVTGPQLYCLHTIGEEGPLTCRVLAEKVHLDPSTLVGIVDRLERKGLVRRQRDTRDRRAVVLQLTEAGRALVHSAPSPLQATLVGKLARLSSEEQGKLADSMEQVVHLLQPEDLATAPRPARPRPSTAAGHHAP